VDDAGEVGIGTATPGEALDVVGNIAVSGTVDGVDIATHAVTADAHREHATLEESAEIDSDITTHANDNDAHHTPGAPSDVNYLVGTADGGLSNEITVGTSPGGQLGNTWASPTVDTAHAADGLNCSTGEAAQGVNNSHAAQSCINVAVRGGEALVDNRLLRANGTTGLQGSGITINDSEAVSGIGTITQLAAGDIVVGDDISGADDISAVSFTFSTTPDNTGSVDICRDGLTLADCASSRRHKADIEPWGGGVTEVLALRPVSFRWRSGVPGVGLIAEEVVEVIPDSIVAEGDGVVRNFHDRAVIAALIGAIQDQQKQISVLRRALSELDGRIRPHVQ
jgi:hypothetical protein